MKGIILAGGEGTRLSPLTKITSKQLLPVYDQPMIYYPLNTLLKAGIRDILFIVSPDHAGDFVELLGSGSNFNARFTFEVQEKPEGIAQALLLGEDFIDNEKVALILGDNIFMDDLSAPIETFESGAKIFLKEVPDPERFGVVEIDDQKNVLSIEEKPTKPKSNYAQTGLYLYDDKAVQLAKTLKPSARGEYEITDLNNLYLQKGELKAEIVQKEWIDAGTFESLHQAACLIKAKKGTGLKVTIKGKEGVRPAFSE